MRDAVSATHIRKLMAEGGDWASLLPPSVAKFIEEISGVERVRVARSSGTSALVR
jgi:nicotinamide-nucleotide adenylyltransferase